MCYWKPFSLFKKILINKKDSAHKSSEIFARVDLTEMGAVLNPVLRFIYKPVI